MKKFEEMTDQELSSKYFATGWNSDWRDHEAIKKVSDEMSRRLSSHPAQRIADATGFPVTVDADGTACMWVNTDWRVLEAYEINGVWRCDNNFENIELDTTGWPDDNRPWQESIYRPRGVKMNRLPDDLSIFDGATEWPWSSQENEDTLAHELLILTKLIASERPSNIYGTIESYYNFKLLAEVKRLRKWKAAISGSLSRLEAEPVGKDTEGRLLADWAEAEKEFENAQEF